MKVKSDELTHLQMIAYNMPVLTFRASDEHGTMIVPVLSDFVR
jgi:hypothetical protein